MWTKQEQNSHVGMVYTTYLWRSWGMVYYCFTHICKPPIVWRFQFPLHKNGKFRDGGSYWTIALPTIARIGTGSTLLPAKSGEFKIKTVFFGKFRLNCHGTQSHSSATSILARWSSCKETLPSPFVTLTKQSNSAGDSGNEFHDPKGSEDKKLLGIYPAGRPKREPMMILVFLGWIFTVSWNMLEKYDVLRSRVYHLQYWPS